MRWPWLCALLLGSEDPDRVNPDRANLTNSTTLVAPGAVQIEAGIDAQVHGRADNDPFRVAMPLLIRIGLHERAELRLIEGDPWRWAQGTIGARQQGEVSLGAKLELWSHKHRSLGLEPQLMPVSPQSAAHFRALLPGLMVLLSLEPGSWHLDFNLGAKLRAASSGRCCDSEALVTASFGRDFLDRRLQLWVESYARVALVQGELSEVAGDLGLIVTVHRRVALDIAGLVGQVGGDTLVAAVLAGISVRIDPMRRTRPTME